MSKWPRFENPLGGAWTLAPVQVTFPRNAPGQVGLVGTGSKTLKRDCIHSRKERVSLQQIMIEKMEGLLLFGIPSPPEAEGLAIQVHSRGHRPQSGKWNGWEAVAGTVAYASPVVDFK